MEGNPPLRDIISSADVIESAPPNLSSLKVLRSSPVGPVKIRAYATEDEAIAQENLLDNLAGKIVHPELLGRWRQYLVFRYLEAEMPKDGTGDQPSYFQIGRFLGILNTIQKTDTSSQDLDKEFVTWLDRLQAMQILPSKIADKARITYTDTRPPNLPVVLDYWDAMPHNFAWTGEKLYLLDEKHLRPSYPGVGLIKPLFLLSHERWTQVREGYESIASLHTFDQYRPFLAFYYLVVALHFYSLLASAGRAKLLQNPRFLNYREALLRKVSNHSRIDKFLAELHLYRSFPTDIPHLIRRRVRNMINVEGNGQ